MGNSVASSGGHNDGLSLAGCWFMTKQNVKGKRERWIGGRTPLVLAFQNHGGKSTKSTAVFVEERGTSGGEFASVIGEEGEGGEGGTGERVYDGRWTIWTGGRGGGEGCGGDEVPSGGRGGGEV